MTAYDFVNTKLFGALFNLLCFAALLYFAYQAGKASGYNSGYDAGVEANPQAKVLVVSEYIFDNKRIARFDPRSPDYFLIMDFNDQTIARVPTHTDFKKEVIVEKTTNEDSRKEK